MTTRKFRARADIRGRTDLRDEIVIALIALLVPLATLPAMIGL